MNTILATLRAKLAPVGARVADAMEPVGKVLGMKPVKYPLRTAAVLLLYALPILHLPLINTENSDFSGVLFTVGTYVLVALGLNIVIGYAGLLDLGYVGFYAVGAYTVGVITSEHGEWPFFLALPLALVVTMISGVLLGAPTLRVRGDYLAIVTMGFGEIIRIVARNTEWLGGAGGINSIPSPPDIGPEEGLFKIPHLSWEYGYPTIDDRVTTVLHFGVLDATPYFWMILTTIILVICADMLIKNSRVGRAWEATREDEDVAELMGVPTFKFKLLAFAMGACIGGLAGAMYATRVGFINPPSFPLMLSMLFVAAVVIGGAGNRWGAILGAVIVAYLPERFREFADWRLWVFGIALIAIVSFRTQGLFPGRAKKRVAEAEREVEKLEEEVEVV
jgi:branched-chain amino acid transport system permease protein